MSHYDHALVWFRRDLRLHDHAALHHALLEARCVSGVFVFDTDILNRLPSTSDRRVEFIWYALRELDQALSNQGGGLIVLHGAARERIPELAGQLRVDAVYANHDYEPDAIARDEAVKQALAKAGRVWRTFKDQVIFEKDEILTQTGRPFTVFTPYKNAWLKNLSVAGVRAHTTAPKPGQLRRPVASSLPSLEDIGFKATNLTQLKLPLAMSGGTELLREFSGRMDQYKARRDYPAIRGPSYLSVHLRFGTVSIRELVRTAMEQRNEGAETWMSELIWREFYCQILWHHPHVVTRSFKPEFDRLVFTNSREHFDAWCEGRTGYPIVDAAMRQINASGYMHNRLRMIVASFLVKDLHVDWRWGEAYFAQHLNDFDLSSNNGGWQWAASTGCDSQPYFRIFNPITQSEKFDPEGKFIRAYLPELVNVPSHLVHAPWLMDEREQRAAGVDVGTTYPRPIVDHAVARSKTLEMFKRALAAAAET